MATAVSPTRTASESARGRIGTGPRTSPFHHATPGGPSAARAGGASSVRATAAPAARIIPISVRLGDLGARVVDEMSQLAVVGVGQALARRGRGRGGFLGRFLGDLVLGLGLGLGALAALL